MIRGAIFDVDGTLLDSMPIWDTVAGDYLLSLGIQPREDLTKTFQTFTLTQSARYYQEVYGVTRSVEEIIAGVNGIIADFYRFTAPLKPGAADFLRALHDRGVKLAIATATDRPLVEAALDRCGVLSLFSHLFTCTEVGHGKEEPHIFHTAQASLGTAQAETWVFEDALHAARTAKTAGFPLCAVFDPSEPRQAELKDLADLYFPGFPVLDPEAFH